MCTSQIWISVSFPRLEEFSGNMSSNIFSGPFYLSCPTRMPVMWMLVYQTLSQRCLKPSLFSFFFFSCSVAMIYTTLISQLTDRSSVLFNLLECFLWVGLPISCLAEVVRVPISVLFLNLVEVPLNIIWTLGYYKWLL